MSETHSYKYKIKDLITKEIFESNSVLEMGKKIGADHSSIQRLLNRQLKGPLYNSIKDRYICLENSKTFFLVDYGSGEEFECCSNATIFLYFNKPWNENISKHITAVKKQKQKILSFEGKVFYLKGFKPEKIRPQKSMTKEYLKQIENEKINRNIKSRLMGRINGLKRKLFFVKSARTEELLGCSISEFKDYLESQFEDWMDWDNCGSEHKNGFRSWHIDHIVPCGTFDLSDPEEQKRCFHYTNMRPLCEQENLKRPKDGRDIFPDLF